MRGARRLPHRARAPRALRAADDAAREARDRRRPRRRRVRDRDAPRARRARRRADAPPPQPAPGATMVYKAAEAAEPGGRARPRRSSRETGDAHGRRRASTSCASARSCSAARRTATSSSPTRTSRGATRRCGRRASTYWTLVDLDSTNGIEVDGKRVKELALDDGAHFTIGSTEIVFSQEARLSLADSASVAGRDHPPCPQDRLPRPALPLHLAHRPLRLPRPAPAAGVDDPLAAAGVARCSPSRSRASSAGSSSSTSPALEEGDVYAIDSDGADGRPRRRQRPRRRRRRVRLVRATRASSRGATASTSRTSARRTARSSTASA